MYLSKVILSGNNLRDPYELHRILWDLFPNSASEQQRDFLFRVEQKNNQQVQVLLQSARKPAGVTSTSKILATKNILIEPDPDTRLRFMLCANPVKTIKDERGRTNDKGESIKCRVPLIDETELHNWFERKLKDAAKLEFLEIEKQMPLYFKKSSRKGKIQPYVYKGVLQVSDRKGMVALIEKGIGPAKAFGCGMLSLAAA